MYMAALTVVKTTLELSFCRHSFLPVERAALTPHSSRETVAAWLQGPSHHHHIVVPTSRFISLLSMHETKMTSDHLIKPPVFFYFPSTPAHWHAHQSYSCMNQATSHPKKNARPSNKKMVSMVVNLAASEAARLDAMTDETVSTRRTVVGKRRLQRVLSRDTAIERGCGRLP